MIRLLTVEDSDAYYSVVHEGYSSILAEGVDFAAGESSKEELTRWLAVNPTYGLFLDSGELVSAITLRMPWGPNPGPHIAPHLGQVSTLPKYKHQGYSYRLFCWLEENVFRKTLLVPEVTLGTAEGHPWLVKMYEKWGFTSFGSKQGAGKKHRTLYMHKIY